MFAVQTADAATKLDCLGNTKKLEEMILKGDLATDLTTAMSNAKSAVQKNPLGRKTPCRAVDDVRKLLAEPNATGCLFSGTLSMLDLGRPAVEGFDTSRIHWTLGTFGTIPDLMKGIATVTINADAWTSAEFEDLQRFDKDAEVQSLCLLLHWAKGTPQEAPLLTACADLVFDAQRKGLGSKLASSKMIHLECEESKRHVLASSASRKCLVICDAAQHMVIEGRFPRIKSEGERLEKVFKEDNVPMGNLSADTLKRYLALARRLTPEMQALLMKWEMFEKRGSLVDGIKSLRAVLGVTRSDEDCNVYNNIIIY